VGRGEFFVDRCEMIFQRLLNIFFHAMQLGFLRLKLRDALPVTSSTTMSMSASVGS
jgi:hypothetical protein